MGKAKEAEEKGEARISKTKTNNKMILFSKRLLKLQLMLMFQLWIEKKDKNYWMSIKIISKGRKNQGL